MFRSRDGHTDFSFALFRFEYILVRTYSILNVSESVASEWPTLIKTIVEMMVKMELNEPIAAAVGLDALLLDRLEAAATD